MYMPPPHKQNQFTCTTSHQSWFKQYVYQVCFYLASSFLSSTMLDLNQCVDPACFCACTAVLYVFWRSVILTMLFFDNLSAVLKHGRIELYLCCIQYLNTQLLISRHVFTKSNILFQQINTRWTGMQVFFKVLTSCLYF